MAGGNYCRCDHAPASHGIKPKKTVSDFRLKGGKYRCNKCPCERYRDSGRKVGALPLTTKGDAI